MYEIASTPDDVITHSAIKMPNQIVGYEQANQSTVSDQVARKRCLDPHNRPIATLY